MKEGKRRGKVYFLLKSAGILAIIGSLLISIFVGSIYLGFFGSMPGKSALKNIRNEKATLLFSHDHKLIGKIPANLNNQSFLTSTGKGC